MFIFGCQKQYELVSSIYRTRT